MSRTVKRVLGTGGLLVLAALLVLLLRPGPVTVETASTTVAPLRETVDEQGQTRVRDRYVVAAPVAGRASRITLREGDRVTRGQVVATVSAAPLDAASRQEALARVALAEDAARATAATVEQARSALAQASRDLQRAEQLRANGMIAPDQLEQAQLLAATRRREMESADFRAQAAAHDVEAARALARQGPGRPVPLRSPTTGRVLRVPERSERVVRAGEPLLEIGDPARLEIVADLLSTEAVRVRPGNEILIEGWGGAPLQGTLRLIEPSGFTKLSALGVEEQRVNVVGDFDQPPAGLGDRFRVELRIVVWEGTVLQVPASAVFRQGAGWALFTVESGRARLREVGVGHRTPFAVEITSGVGPGVVVIRDPSDRVTEGARVRSETR